jgi:hypothetical protein
MLARTGATHATGALRRETARSRDLAAGALDLVQGILSKRSHRSFYLQLALARAGLSFARRHPAAAVALTVAGVAVLAMMGRTHARHLER